MSLPEAWTSPTSTASSTLTSPHTQRTTSTELAGQQELAGKLTLHPALYHVPIFCHIFLRSGKAITFVSQYDVELYQRIEQLVGKRLPLFETEKNEVMTFQERVDEATR